MNKFNKILFQYITKFKENKDMIKFILNDTKVKASSVITWYCKNNN